MPKEKLFLVPSCEDRSSPYGFSDQPIKGYTIMTGENKPEHEDFSVYPVMPIGHKDLYLIVSYSRLGGGDSGWSDKLTNVDYFVGKKGLDQKVYQNALQLAQDKAKQLRLGLVDMTRKDSPGYKIVMEVQRAERKIEEGKGLLAKLR